jgi:hypothetical protein
MMLTRAVALGRRLGARMETARQPSVSFGI